MKGSPPTKHEILDQVDTVVKAVDQRGRDMDRRWGLGRLTALVPVDVAERFRSQRRKFSAAVWEYDAEQVQKHGAAMLRAYDALDALAVAARGEPAPPDQWEVETPDGLMIVVRDLADTNRVALDGRQASVWSLEEVANLIRAHPSVLAVKRHFPGAVVESVRPDADAVRHVDAELMAVPF